MLPTPSPNIVVLTSPFVNTLGNMGMIWDLASKLLDIQIGGLVVVEKIACRDKVWANY